MKVKIFDLEDEKDLEDEINKFLSENTINVIEIKYQVSIGVFSEEQVFCFSAMIIYSQTLRLWRVLVFFFSICGMIIILGGMQ